MKQTNKKKRKKERKKKKKRKKRVVGLIHSLQDRQRGRFGKGEKKGDSYQKGKVNKPGVHSMLTHRGLTLVPSATSYRAERVLLYHICYALV